MNQQMNISSCLVLSDTDIQPISNKYIIYPMVVSAMKKVKQGQGERAGGDSIGSRSVTLCGEA